MSTIYQSPQVVINELDISQIAESAFGNSYLILGEAATGRDDRAILINSKASYVNTFGAVGANFPSSYAAMEYLSYGDNLWYKRVTSTRFVKVGTQSVTFTAPVNGSSLGKMTTAAISPYLLATTAQSPITLYIEDTTGAYPFFKVFVIGYAGTGNDFTIYWDAYGRDFGSAGLNLGNATFNAFIYVGHAEPSFSSQVWFPKPTAVQSTSILVYDPYWTQIEPTLSSGSLFVTSYTAPPTYSIPASSIGTITPLANIISNMVGGGTTVTVTTTHPHNLTTGELVYINGTGQANWDTKTFTVASTPSSTQFTFTDTTVATVTVGTFCLYYNSTASTLETVGTAQNAFYRIAFARVVGTTVYLSLISEWIAVSLNSTTNPLFWQVQFTNLPAIPAGYQSIMILKSNTAGSANYPSTSDSWQIVGTTGASVFTDETGVVFSRNETRTSLGLTTGSTTYADFDSGPSIMLNNIAATSGQYVIQSGDGSTVSAAYSYESKDVNIVDATGSPFLGSVTKGTVFCKYGYAEPTVGSVWYHVISLDTSTSISGGGIDTILSTSSAVTGQTLTGINQYFWYYSGMASAYTLPVSDTVYLSKTVLGYTYYYYTQDQFNRYSAKSKSRGSDSNLYSILTAYNQNTNEYELLVYDSVGAMQEKWTDTDLSNLMTTITEYSNFITISDLSDSTATTVVYFDTTLAPITGIPYYRSILNGGYSGYFPISAADFIANISTSVAASKFAVDPDYADLLASAQQIEYFDGTMDYELMAIPGWSSDPSLATTMDTTARNRVFSSCIVDLPAQLTPDMAIQYRNSSFGTLDSSYTAMFWNYGKIYDANNDINVWLPPTVFAIRAMSLTDSSSLPWAAAAGLRRGLVPEILELENYPTLPDRDNLYMLQINPIARIGTQVAVWGNRTTQKIKSMLSNYNTRRMLVAAEKAVYLATQSALFDPNDATERQRLILTMQPIFDRIRQQRGLLAFGIFDATTDDDAAMNIARFSVELQPTPTIEVIVHTFVIKNPTQPISGSTTL